MGELRLSVTCFSSILATVLRSLCIKANKEEKGEDDAVIERSRKKMRGRENDEEGKKKRICE